MAAIASLDSLAAEFKSGIPVRDRIYRLQKYPAVFTGDAAIEWLINTGNASSYADATGLASQLMHARVFQLVAGGNNSSLSFQPGFVLYRISANIPTPTNIPSLNSIVLNAKASDSAAFDRKLHRIESLLSTRQAKHVGDDSKSSLPQSMLPPSAATETPHALEQAALRILKQHVQVKDRRYRLKVYKKCFIGSDAVKTMIQTGLADDAQMAIVLGNKMMELGYFDHVCRQHSFEDGYLFYRFEDELVVVGRSSRTGSLSMTISSPSSVSGGGELDLSDRNLEMIARKMYSGLEIIDRSYRLSDYACCFVASEAVDFLISKGYVNGIQEALLMGNRMLTMDYFNHVCHEHAFEHKYLFFRFQIDEALEGKKIILSGVLKFKKLNRSVFQQVADDIEWIDRFFVLFEDRLLAFNIPPSADPCTIESIRDEKPIAVLLLSPDMRINPDKMEAGAFEVQRDDLFTGFKAAPTLAQEWIEALRYSCFGVISTNPTEIKLPNSISFRIRDRIRSSVASSSDAGSLSTIVEGGDKTALFNNDFSYASTALNDDDYDDDEMQYLTSQYKAETRDTMNDEDYVIVNSANVDTAGIPPILEPIDGNLKKSVVLFLLRFPKVREEIIALCDRNSQGELIRFVIAVLQYRALVVSCRRSDLKSNYQREETKKPGQGSRIEMINPVVALQRSAGHGMTSLFEQLNQVSGSFGDEYSDNDDSTLLTENRTESFELSEGSSAALQFAHFSRMMGQFVETGSPMQVNVSDKMRKSVRNIVSEAQFIEMNWISRCIVFDPMAREVMRLVESNLAAQLEEISEVQLILNKQNEAKLQV